MRAHQQLSRDPRGRSRSIMNDKLLFSLLSECSESLEEGNAVAFFPESHVVCVVCAGVRAHLTKLASPAPREVVTCGAHCLELFVQLNWTGPSISGEVEGEVEALLGKDQLQLLNAQALEALSSDSEVRSHTAWVLFISLGLCARR